MMRTEYLMTYFSKFLGGYWHVGELHCPRLQQDIRASAEWDKTRMKQGQGADTKGDGNGLCGSKIANEYKVNDLNCNKTSLTTRKVARSIQPLDMIDVHILPRPYPHQGHHVGGERVLDYP